MSRSKARELAAMLADSSSLGSRDRRLPSLPRCTSALRQMAGAREWQNATALLEEMWRQGPWPDATCLNAGIGACARAAAWQAALSLLEVMPTAGLERNYISFNATITACARARHWEVSLQLLNAMEENQIASSPATLGAAVSACERGSHWPGALHLLDEGWQKGPEPNVLALSAAMNACGQGQRWDLSLHLLHEAAERSVEIDGITFNCALGACARARRWEEALVLLSDMESLKLAPDEVTHKMVNTAVLDLGVSASELLSGEDKARLSRQPSADRAALDGRVYGHLPILCDEVVQALQPDTYRKPIFVDATFGRGGHSRRLLEVPEATVFALDLDPSAVSEARRLASIEPRLMPVHAAFGDLIQVLPPATELQGLLADLGVSSPQLDQKHRGFSPIEDGPLDMRMNPRKGIPASEWLDNVTPEELAWVLCSYGEDRDPFLAARLAEAICAKRPLQRTIELAEVVADVKAKTVGSSPFQQPARLVFQAIRSHLNQELQELEKLLGAAFQLLMPGGRAVIVCFKGAEVAAVRSWLRQNEDCKAEVAEGLPEESGSGCFQKQPGPACCPLPVAAAQLSGAALVRARGAGPTQTFGCRGSGQHSSTLSASARS
ncbi:Ribosomal RNA small subunit methyltransferase H (16S rRNA m(4)C1402 methyltransferase) (rRNA (cytosine-N(4)-)-methyltransferase RsmH) [Durusdinium trenchii]|uniref:Ribosomal RNA small subunit methyltransferase H (16S rRNA m(4)C1402 methyltransferase) (rRNA (cytosine-N(4)-)-methyltransferase RsmH) n=1 Tax=Durusdinium trenchii TaxID=1381693 RepID=A0ABP0KUC0_9DINO